MMLPSTTRWSIMCCVICSKILLLLSFTLQCSSRFFFVCAQISCIQTWPSESAMYPAITLTVPSPKLPSAHSAHCSSAIAASPITADAARS